MLRPRPPYHTHNTPRLYSTAAVTTGPRSTAGKVRRIICMCGAGISVSAGIPDFRTPGSGLYHRLEQYDLPYPQVFFAGEFSW